MIVGTKSSRCQHRGIKALGGWPLGPKGNPASGIDGLVCLFAYNLHTAQVCLVSFPLEPSSDFLFPQVTAYNRDSFDTTRQRLLLLIGDPEGTIPVLYW